MRTLRTLVVAIVALVLLAGALPAVPQDEPGEPAAEGSTGSPPIDKAEALLESLRRDDTALVDLVRETGRADGEDLALRRDRFVALVGEQDRGFAALAKIVAARSASGADAGLLSQQTAQLMNRASRRLQDYIREFEQNLSQEAIRRGEVADDQIQEYEHRMAVDTDRLDHLYLSLVRLSDQMTVAGVDASATRTFLGEQLEDRGAHLVGLLELTARRLKERGEDLQRVPGEASQQARLFAAEERFDANKTALAATIHMLKALGLDQAQLEVEFVEITGEITPDAVGIEVAEGLADRWLQRAEAFFVESGPRIVLRAGIVALILFVFWFLARLTRRGVDQALSRSQVTQSRLFREMVSKMAGRAILAVGVILVLSQVGLDPGPILAGLGVAGIVIGFALQDSLANFAAGVMILAYRPYDIGDFVEAGGVQGKVHDMNLVSTRIFTVDHQSMIVPNNKIWGDVIRNVTALPKRRVDLVFGIGYEDDIAQAERVLLEIVTGHTKVLPDPAPVIKLHTLNDSSVDFVVRPWVLTEDYWDVYWDLTRAVKVRFDEEGISIPYPQRDIHLIGGSDGDGGG